jgi:hypothetical protein
VKVGDYVEVVDDGNIGLSLVGERGRIIGPGDNGYEWEVEFPFKSGGAYTMWFNTDELKLVEEGQA